MSNCRQAMVPAVPEAGASKARKPYDGHTLAAQLEQTGILLQDIGIKQGLY